MKNAPGLGGRISSASKSDAFSAFRATGSEDLTASLRAHTRTETMDSGMYFVLRLIRHLHNIYPPAFPRELTFLHIRLIIILAQKTGVKRKNRAFPHLVFHNEREHNISFLL